MIDQLIEIIGREAVLFESFLELLEQQQQMLIHDDIDGLNQVTELQRQKVLESQALDGEREQLVVAVREQNDIEGDLNITRLLDLVDDARAERLTQLRTTVRDINEKIMEVRNQNANLLNRSREYIQKTMQMLSRINQPEGNYTPTGVSDPGRMNVAVDRRA